MNRTELVHHVAADAGVERSQADAVISALVETVGATLARGEQVSIAPLGSFNAVAVTARTGRNPRTGEPLEIAATTRAAFRPSAALKRRVAGTD